MQEHQQQYVFALRTNLRVHASWYSNSKYILVGKNRQEKAAQNSKNKADTRYARINSLDGKQQTYQVVFNSVVDKVRYEYSSSTINRTSTGTRCLVGARPGVWKFYAKEKDIVV